MQPPLTATQRRKLEKLVKVMEDGPVALLQEIVAIEEKVDQAVAKVEAEVGELKNVVEPRLENILVSIRGKDGANGKDSTVPGPKGDKGDTVIGPKGDKGDSVVGPQGLMGLPGTNGESIVGPPGLPGKDGSPDTALQVRDKLETLRGEERLDIDHIKGFGKRLAKMSDEILKRAIGILDQRTQFLINKVSNIQAQVNALTGGGSFAVVVISGTIDDSNVTFTATSLPTVLVINGGIYKQAGGAYTWSYLAGVITLSAAVGTGGSIFGL